MSISRFTVIDDKRRMLIGRDINKVFKRGVVYEARELCGDIVLSPIGKTSLPGYETPDGEIKFQYETMEDRPYKYPTIGSPIGDLICDGRSLITREEFAQRAEDIKNAFTHGGDFGIKEMPTHMKDENSSIQMGDYYLTGYRPVHDYDVVSILQGSDGRFYYVSEDDGLYKSVFEFDASYARRLYDIFVAVESNMPSTLRDEQTATANEDGLCVKYMGRTGRNPHVTITIDGDRVISMDGVLIKKCVDCFIDMLIKIGEKA